MGVPQTLRFAGIEAAVGLGVMGLFGLVMASVATGLVAVWATGLVPDPGILAGAGVVGAMAVLLLRQIWRDWRRFRVLRIEEDGTWRLINPVGVVLLTLAPRDKRAVDAFEREVWLFLGTPRRDRVAWIQVELPDGRIFLSARSTARSQAPAHAALAAHIRGAAG